MASIATLFSNLGMLQKLLGMLRKGGLPDDFLQRLIDERRLRDDLVVWAKTQYEQSSSDHEAEPEPAIPLVERVSDTAIRVNLDATHNLPFKGAEIEWNEGEGWVTVERREDDLYVDGTRVVLHLVEGQQAGSVQGYELRTQLQGQRTLHPNVLDALFENQHLIPESWKVDEQGRTRFIYFWAVGYRGSRGDLCVRCLYWGDGAWYRSYYWLGDHWGDQDPAAVLAS